MSKCTPKPRLLDVFRWTGGPDQIEDPEWIVELIKAGNVTFETDSNDSHNMLIDFSGGFHINVVYPGDFVLWDGKKPCVCSQNSFHEIYDMIPDHWRHEGFNDEPSDKEKDARIHELENEVAFLKGKIEGVRFVPLPVQPEYRERLPYTGNPVKLPYEVPSTKKSWEPPYEVTCINGAGTAIGSWKVKGNPIDIIGPERK